MNTLARPPESGTTRQTDMERLAALGESAIAEWMRGEGQPKFRARQVLDWIFREWTLDPEKMSNLPKALRKRLGEAFACGTCRVAERLAAADGTVKLLVELADGETVECVVLPAARGRAAFCLSTQVGCPVGCRFCASGADGLIRDLTAGEIIETMILCCGELGDRPDNIVLMGSGEPLMNLDNVLPALDAFTDPERFGMARRRITVSTSGWTKGVDRLAREAGQCNLAVSLHGPDDETRAKLIPKRSRRPIREILEACERHRDAAKRMTTFEYVLIKGLNDSDDQAARLAEIARRHRAKINLIPYNETGDQRFARPEKGRIDSFFKILVDSGARATLRVERGSEIAAACGQLRRRRLAGEAASQTP